MDTFNQSCRVCGCTEMQACPEGCSWIEPDLCSACAIGDGDIGVFARGNAGVARIAKERLRHLAEEGYTLEDDLHYAHGELAAAAACYASNPAHRPVGDPPGAWPWSRAAWKPGSRTTEGRIRELEKAGALIAAEIDRLLATGES